MLYLHELLHEVEWASLRIHTLLEFLNLLLSVFVLLIGLLDLI